MLPPLTIALTGGTGAIGSRFLAEAVGRGLSVRSLSRSPSQLREVDWRPFDLVKQHGSDADALQGVDQVLHLAAYIPRDHDDPEEGLRCWQTNVSGTHRLIEAMAKAGVRRLIQAGSANIYAPWLVSPDENSLIHPQTRTFYLGSKAAQEWCAEEQCRRYSIDLVTVRLSSVFGTGVGALDTMARKLLDGETVELNNDGLFGADFVSSDDVLKALFLLLDSDGAGTFNVASGNRSTIAEVAEILRETTGRSADAVRAIPRADSADGGFPAINISKLRALGYRPATLREGIVALVGRLSDSKLKEAG